MPSGEWHPIVSCLHRFLAHHGDLEWMYYDMYLGFPLGSLLLVQQYWYAQSQPCYLQDLEFLFHRTNLRATLLVNCAIQEH